MEDRAVAVDPPPLGELLEDAFLARGECVIDEDEVRLMGLGDAAQLLGLDRKSTRLNSSHLVISYAVFCLKKKKERTRAVRIANATDDVGRVCSRAPE